MTDETEIGRITLDRAEALAGLHGPRWPETGWPELTTDLLLGAGIGLTLCAIAAWLFARPWRRMQAGNAASLRARAALAASKTLAPDERIVVLAGILRDLIGPDAWATRWPELRPAVLRADPGTTTSQGATRGTGEPERSAYSAAQNPAAEALYRRGGSAASPPDPDPLEQEIRAALEAPLPPHTTPRQTHAAGGPAR